MANVPVYLFLGFLDSGKTKFIHETLCDKRFQDGDKTLVILCEEGEEELDTSKYAGGRNVTIVTLENKEQLTTKFLEDSVKKSRAERVMIEYNGMWLLNDLGEVMPRNWQIEWVNEIYHSNDHSVSFNYFSDIQVSYRTKTIEAGVRMSNIFGTSNYERQHVSSYATTCTINRLRPREILAKISIDL